MNTALSPYTLGVLTPFAAIGALLAAGALVWLAAVMIPEGVWWTVKRLSLHNQVRRDVAASLVAGARRAYVLRIPLGVRLVLVLGGDRHTQEEVLDTITAGRRANRGVAP